MAIKRPASGWNVQRVTAHPGEILLEEFLKPLKLSQHSLAMQIRVPATRIASIVHGRRSITADTALRLGKFFRNSPEFWMNLQQAHELSLERTAHAAEIEREVQAYKYAG